MKHCALLGFLALSLIFEFGARASEPKILCDPSDPANRCPGSDCRCVPDTLEIVFDDTSTSVYEYPPGQAFPIPEIAVTVYMDTKTDGIIG